MTPTDSPREGTDGKRETGITLLGFPVVVTPTVELGTVAFVGRCHDHAPDCPRCGGLGYVATLLRGVRTEAPR